MKDGEIDYARYSTAGLKEALVTIDRARFPRNYEKLVATLHARGEPSVGGNSAADDAARIPPSVFHVRYTVTPVVGAPDNDMGFAGKGTIEFSGHLVHLSGKETSFWWPREQSVAFPLGSLSGVARVGGFFRIEFAPPGDARVQAAFRAGDAEADVLASRLTLPSQMASPEPKGAVADFEQRILAASPRTPATWALIALNVAAFIAMAFAGAGIVLPDPAVHVRWGSNVVPLTVDGEWWRLASSMFLHFGLMHLAINMWVLYAQGRLAERLFGTMRFIALYLLAGVAGSVASAWWNPAVNSAGASGAIFGMLGGLIAFMLTGRHAVPLPVLKAQRASLFVFIFYSFAYGATREGIDNAAHFGGLAAGLLLGLALARPVDPQLRSQPAPLRVAAVAMVAAALLTAAAYSIVNFPHRGSADDRFAAAAVWFVHREAPVIDGYNELAKRAHAGDVDDDAYADELARRVLPFYAEADRRFGDAVGALIEPDDRQKKFAEYVVKRHKAFEMAEQAARSGDSGHFAEAMAMMSAADVIVGELNKEPGSAGP